MQNFSYKARDAAGKQVAGVMEADSMAAVVNSLRGSNLFIIEVKPVKSLWGSFAPPTLASIKENLQPKVRSKDLAVFCRQFSTMIEAGVPLLASLEILKAQANHPILKNTLQGMRSHLEDGDTLAEALRAYPKVFPPILVNMVEAGEVGGALDRVMARLAVHFEKEHEIQEKVKSAMTYPLVVLVVALLAVIFLLAFVLPNFTQMLTNMGVPLPLPTMIVIGISGFFQRFWYFTPVFFGAMAVGLMRLSRTPRGRAWKDRTLLRLPIFGDVIRKMIVSRFTRTFGTLLKGGVPILQALEVVKRTVGNTTVMAGIEEAQAAIRDGRGMAEPLAACNVFPPMVIQMISVGEETGTIDNLLEKISVFYDEEVDQVIGRLSSMIEPLLIVGLGGLVGFIILSILLPMFSVVGGIQ
ncbi:MAG: type II secretion system F family protein [Bacillota bacterium]